MDEKLLTRPLPAVPDALARRRVLLATGVSYVVVLLDASIVNVALNSISTRLAVGVDGLQWVVNAYTLAFASLLLTGGTLADRWGARRAYLAGLLLFTVASAGCGVASGLPVLAAGRAVQGAGAALLVPAALALINHAHPEPDRRARAVGIWMSLGGVAMAAGPPIGGALITALGWRSIFFVNLPIGLVGVWLAWPIAEQRIRSVAGRLDLVGQVTAVLALGLPIAVLIQGRDWGAPLVGAALAAAAAAAVVFLVVEARGAHPMLPLSLFRSRVFAGSTVASATSALVFYGLLFVCGLYFQQVRGYSPLRAGLALLPLTASVAFGGFGSARVARRFGARWSMCAAFGLYALGALGLLGATRTSPYWAALAPMLVIGLAGGFISPAATAPALGTVERGRAGVAAAALNTARQSGSAVGVAAFGSLVGGLHPFETGLRVVLGLIALASVAAAAVWARTLGGPRPRFGRAVQGQPDPSSGGTRRGSGRCG
ncbi:MFS transporter [Streptacidiphilus sp. P02-A3a]|uniref:MFS transporter n=1 Tax=Streptacidiphilus sp. P02-A3a TaxID=2704468 RepID=UPI0015FACFC2|nr:MFS transporter [Streptacidiphilus sp. P02-A3a]QMU73417.1 MFS transporter [Streptacidiphilus sp. P02-A3a]